MAELRTQEQVLALAKGTSTLSRFGQLVPHRLRSKAEWHAFEQARRTGFLSVKAGSEALSNVWWCWCEVSGRPYVVVRQKVKYARVQYDLIALDHELSAEGQQIVRDLFVTSAHLGACLSFGRNYGDVETKAEDSADVASRLLDILKSPKYHVLCWAPQEGDIP